MSLHLIAQNISIYPGDNKHPFARTGEIGCYEIKRSGATGLILGHSEVNDQPEIVNKKFKEAVKQKLLNNIVLVGERWEDLGKEWIHLSLEQKNKIKKLLKKRFLQILEGINSQVILKTVFGYEPGWGVRGSGKKDVSPPQPEQIGQMIQLLREIMAQKYNPHIASRARIIYGGTSTPERVKEILRLKEIDGFILGSAGTKISWIQKIGLLLKAVVHQRQNKKKLVLALNWKAYPLKRPYLDFIKIVKKFDKKKLDIYLAPPATDLYLVHRLMTQLKD